MSLLKFILIVSLPLLISQTVLCQIEFQPGYFVKNSGETVKCLIKNLDWKNNPSSFKYKIKGEENVLTGNIDQIKEFSITAFSKYIRETVMIDLSSSLINRLDRTKEPKFEEKTIFLKVLIEAEASLYEYESGSEVRYFYETVDKPITQLIYKKYITDNNLAKTNGAYKFQLFENINCGDVQMQKIQDIEYKKNDLVEYFKSINSCFGAEVNEWDENKKKGTKLKFYVQAGVRRSNLKVESLFASRNIEFNNTLGYSVGLVPEIILPFNRNKWSVFGGLIARFIKGTEELRLNQVVFRYNTIEVLLGMRHYFYLNEDSKIFVNPLYSYGFKVKSILDFENQNNLEVASNHNLGIGAGYAFKRYTAELRYEHCRNVSYGISATKSCHKSLGLFLGYQL